MSAEVLRQAAALMRERAGAANPSPWVTNSSGYVFGRIPGDEVLARGRVADASHIASWHPAVGLAVADFLDWEADQAERFQAQNSVPMGMVNPRIVAVARAYLGSDR